MKKHRLTWFLCLLSLLTYVFLQTAQYFPSFVETFYSRGINHFMTSFISRLTGFLPFSLAEFGLYGLILYFLIHILYRIFKCLNHPNTWKLQIKSWLFHTLNLICFMWLIFTWGWTFNYSRIPLQTLLNLKASDAPEADLVGLYQYLISDLNALHSQIIQDDKGYMIIEGGYQSVFERAPKVYDSLSIDYPIFKGKYGAPKSILASKLMNYTGLTGIYAPFTREANVNTATLPQTIPATTLHEMAHQRGFAEEEACNFIAYLASTYTDDIDFKYSSTLLALAYTSQALAQIDCSTLVTLNQTIDAGVMKDIQQNNAFWKSYAGSVEEVSTSLNNTYLKANGVSDGVKSYGRMVDLLLSYYVTFIQPSLSPQNFH